MSARPYIGVTGFMSRAEVDATLAAFPGTCSHDLMIGVLASSKTLRGGGNRYPLRYPLAGQIANLFPSQREGVLNLVHYATGGEQDYRILSASLCRAMEVGGPTCDGLQVNASWPAPRALAMFRAIYPNARVVLQLGPGAMACMGGDSAGIAQRVAREYNAAATDVLIDVSGGRGTLVDGAVARALVTALRAAGPWGIGIAGGLCAETLSDVVETVGGIDGLSIDAEGRLRDEAEGGGRMVLDKMRGYLSVAASIVAGVEGGAK